MTKITPGPGSKVMRLSAGETVAVVIGTTVLIALMLFVNLLINGIVIMQLFNWFAVPIIGLPEIGFWLAAGLGLFVGWLTYTDTTFLAKADKKEEKKTLWGTLILNNMIIRPVFVLLLGWFVHAMAF